jgi:hypothetical protein
MKKFKLPKDSLVEPEQGRRPGPGEQFIDGGDVEGHSLPTPAPPTNLPTTAPPSFDAGVRRGGEFAPTDTEDGDSK